MKKIRIDTSVTLKDTVSTIGEQLWPLLEGMPADDAKAAVHQVKLADELKALTDQKAEWFTFEEDDQSHIERAIDKGAKLFAAKTIAPIQEAMDAMVAFKGVEPPEKSDEPASAEKPADSTPEATTEPAPEN